MRIHLADCCRSFNKYLKYLFIIFCIFVSTPYAFGQLQDSGTPESFLQQNKALSSATVETFTLPKVDNNSLLEKEKSERTSTTKRFQFAHAFDVTITPQNSGTWTSSQEMNIWQLAITSENAYAMNLIFEKFKLPSGASLYVYTPDHEVIYGAFTENNNKNHGKFAIRPLPGSTLIVEYNEPMDSDFTGEIEISKVNHDYIGLPGLKYDAGRRPARVSQSCEINVNCESDPLWLEIKQSVVRILIDGRYLCTGTLLNNTNQDQTPYILTAGHCFYNNNTEQLIMEEYAQTSCIAFNYESPTCSNLDGYTEQTVIGGEARAYNHDLDFFLFELEDEPLPEFEAVYAGWDITMEAPTSATSIHHPSGDTKKISYEEDTPITRSYNSRYQTNAFWQIVKWEQGTTEGGSSGSGLFNSDGNIVGSLTGGAANCSNPVYDYYSKFNEQWDLNSDSSQQLKIWLDPNDTGTTSIGSLNSTTAEGTTCLTIQNFPQNTQEATLLPIESDKFVVGNNSQNIQEIAEYFSQSTNSFVTSVKIVPGTITNKTQEVTLKIYDENNGAPNAVLHSQDINVMKLVSDVENIIDLTNSNGQPIALEVDKSFFVSFTLDHSSATNQFSLYSVPTSSTNTAYALLANQWTPYDNIESLGSTSMALMIRVANCGSAPTTSKLTEEGKPELVQVFYDSSNNNIIYIKAKYFLSNSTIRLYSNTGQMVEEITRELSNEPYQMNLSNYSHGLYVLSVESEGVNQNEKIVVH